MILLVFLSCICSQVRWGSSSMLLEQGNSNNRNLENALTRLNTRLDTIVLRIDHLDNRLGRIQSSVTNRLDGIENSMTNVKLRMDMLSEEVNRVDENLNRKWKIFESKIEGSIGILDSKYESKLNLLLREGRRLGDSFHGLFIGVEKRVSVLVSQVNASLSHLTDVSISSLRAAAAAVATANNNTSAGGLTTTTTTASPPSSTTTTASPNNLIANKVSNMFEDLTERSLKMETMMKDSIALTNATRREMHDSFRSLFAHSNSNYNHHGGGGGGGSSSSSSGSSGRNSRTYTSSFGGGGRGGSGTSVSSSEATSMAILETLASTESMSTTISRRLTELTRSIEERFELVSMTLNGFLESCIRIQEGAPLIEEHIAELLERILNSFENNTTSMEYSRLWDKLDAMEIQMKCEGMNELDNDGDNSHRNGTSLSASSSSSSSSSSTSLPLLTPSFPSLNGNGNSSSSSGSSSSSSPSSNDTQNNYDDIVRNSEHLAEEDKKLLWQSLFPFGHLNGSYVPE